MADEYNFGNYQISSDNPTGGMDEGENHSDLYDLEPVEEQAGEVLTEGAQELQAKEDDDKAKRFANIDSHIVNRVPYARSTSSVEAPHNYANLSYPKEPTAMEKIGASAMSLYRSIFSSNVNDSTLNEAKEYAPTLGVSPQYLVDNPDAMDRARKIYDYTQRWQFLPEGTAFSAQAVDEQYPEVAKLRREDPVGAAIALNNYQDVHQTRGIFDTAYDSAANVVDLFRDAYNSGSDMVKLYDAQMKGVESGDLDAARPEVNEIAQRLKEYQQQDDTQTGLGKIVYDTIQQLTVMGTQGLRATKQASQGAALAMAVAAPAAAGAGALSLGTGAAAIELSAAMTGAAWGMRTGFFNEVSKQSMAQRYWDDMQQKDRSGKNLYTRRQALIDSAFVGAANGAIELGLLEFGYAPIKTAFGKDAAAAIIKDAGARKAIVDEGKLAIAKMAALSGMKQYGRVVGAELTEEAAQQVVSDFADNAEYYINGKQGKWNTTGDIINNAVDAMVQAVPAVIGMGALGAVPKAIGHYNAASALASVKVEDWRQEYQRNVEAQTAEKLVQNKSENKLAAKQPEVYGKVVQEQADKSGMGTMYVDAQELARSPEGVEVLNDAVKRGMVTAEDVDSSLENGTNLEMKTGIFAQLADDTFDTQTLMEATTMNKGGIHRAALKERAARMESIRGQLAELANNKSEKLAQEIMDEHFSADDEDTQAAAGDVLNRNPYDLVQSHKEAAKDALQTLKDLINYTYYDTYEPQGVSIVSSDAEGYDNVQTGRGIRMSNNEPWYSNAYREYGGKPTKQQLLDVAYENERKEHAAMDTPEQYAAWEQSVSSARKHYETLQNMKERFDELANSDLALRKTMSKEAANVYTMAVEVMKHGSPEVAQAAKENAYVYAKMAETWAKIRQDYGDTLYTAEDFAREHPIVLGGQAAGYNQYAGVNARTAAIDQLDIAKKRIDNGEDANVVFKETGWFKGQDGRWRFNIPDDIDKISFERVSNGNNEKLSNIYQNESLYAAYPFLKDMEVVLKDFPDNKHGDFELLEDVVPIIYINKKEATSGSNVAKKTLIHEIQHAIQEEERFSTGGSPDTMNAAIRNSIESIRDELNDIPMGIEYADALTKAEETLFYGNKDDIEKGMKKVDEISSKVPDTVKKKIMFLRQLMTSYKRAAGENNAESYQRLHGEQEARRTADTEGQSMSVPVYDRPLIIFDGQVFEQTAYHASPHKFREFDLGMMGSGEGAQAHGWGIYLGADKEIVKKYYRFIGKAADDPITVGGRPIYELYERLENIASSQSNPEDAKKYYDRMSLIEDIEIKGSTENIENGPYTPETIKWFNREIKKHLRIKGSLIKTEIPENNVLLNEQNELSKQTKEVKEMLKNVVKSFSKEQLDKLKEILIDNLVPEPKTEEYYQKNNELSEIKSEIRAINSLKETENENISPFGKRIIAFMQENLEKKRNDIEKLKSDDEYYKSEISKLQEKQKLLEDYIDDEDSKRDEKYTSTKESIAKSRGPGIIENKYINGGNLYAAISAMLGSPKEASMLLNQYGVKGITYYGDRDGRCFVIFDDTAIKIIEKYNQEHAMGQVKAAYDSGSGAIHLFDAADQSSFIHEAGHMYLDEMERMAAQEGAPEQLVKDWNTINDWLTYSPESIEEYAGTAREAEFRKYEQDLIAARKTGDDIAIKDAEQRWKQERFARAFERYIADGKAPTQALQGPFRKFKAWLITVYKDLRNLGKEPPEDVKRVMDRMIATDDEIEQWAKIKELNAWDRKGFSGDLSGSEGTMIKQWADKIKEESKEKLLAQFMKDEQLTWEADRDAALEQEYISYQKSLTESNELYQLENLYNNMPEARTALLAKYGYKDAAEFQQALQDAGGTLEERTEQYMKNKQKEYDEMMPTPEDIRKAADAQLASTNGQAALNQLEAAAMRKKVNGYIAETVKALRDLGQLSGSEQDVKRQLREMLGVATGEEKAKATAGRALDEVLKKNEKIDQLKKRLESKDATKKENDETIRQLKSALNETMKGLNLARDVTVGSYTAMLKLAHEQLGEMSVSNATTWRQYEMKAGAASRRADVLMAAGNFREAMTEKGRAQKYYCMARAAKDNQDFVRVALEGKTGRLSVDGQEMYGIHGILSRISRTKDPVRMGQHSRYMLQHLSYMLGLTDRDGLMPIDKDGNTVPLNWEYIYRDLSPDYATGQSFGPKPEDLVAPWIRAIVDGKERQDFKDLSMNKFKDVNEAIRAIYSVGKRDYEAISLVNEAGKAISLEDAAKELMQSLKVDENYNPLQEKNSAGRKQRTKEKIGDALLSLTKIETILRNLGPKWLQYIYEPISRAASRELGMRKDACREFARITNFYTTEEWQHIRNDKVYAVGAIDHFTREQILAMALNWGNKEGRERVMALLNKYAKNETQRANEATVEDIFYRALTNKDLDFLEAVWAQLDSYWPERNNVQQHLYGVGLGKVAAAPFTVNGRKVSGGYYPIVYDPELAVRSSEISADDVIKSQLSGNATFGIGMGSTKKREAKVTQQVIATTLDIWPHAVNEAIHHITMREAVMDVYKLINNPDITNLIQQNAGMETYKAIKQWAKDCWKTEIQKQDNISRFLERMRRNTSFAVMAYRTSTAALNLLNVFPMAWRIGTMNAAKAMTDFGLGFGGVGTNTYAENRKFVMAKSEMMAERINTIDRDMQQDMRLQVNQNTPMTMAKLKEKKDAVNRFGYWFITETDLICSMALWKSEYTRIMSESVEKGMTDAAAIEQNAIAAADRAVRDVFGSGSVKDQAAIQRMNSFVGQLTPFYSYSNTVLNALIDAGYKWKGGNKLPMLNAMLFWIVLPTAFESLYRTATAGDADDPDKILKKMGVKLVANTAQGVPIVRDALEAAMNIALEGKSYTDNQALAVSIVNEAINTGTAIASQNKDMTDVGRSASRVANRYVGFSDTLTDGFWSLVRFSLVDTDRSVADLANAMLFDRRYKTAEERKRADKKKKTEQNKK